MVSVKKTYGKKKHPSDTLQRYNKFTLLPPLLGEDNNNSLGRKRSQVETDFRSTNDMDVFQVKTVTLSEEVKFG